MFDFGEVDSVGVLAFLRQLCCGGVWLARMDNIFSCGKIWVTEFKGL